MHPLNSSVGEITDGILERITKEDKALLLSARGKKIGDVRDILADNMGAKSWVANMDGWNRALLDVFLIIDREKENDNG